jgi:hypothetical protein
VAVLVTASERRGEEMAGTPKFKISDQFGTYVAATVDATLAAAVVALLGEGAKVKVYGRIVWREGFEAISAQESYDVAAETMDARIVEQYQERWGGAA